MQPIFLTDLDHTFLRSDLSLSDFTIETWNALSARAALSVATARSYKTTRELLRALHLHVPMILLDGALVVDAQERVIDMQFLDKTTGDAVIAEGAKLGLYPFILSGERGTLNERFLCPSIQTPQQQQVMERNRGRSNLVICDEAAQENFKIVYMGDGAILHELADNLRSAFGETLELKLAPEAYLEGYYLTVLRHGADKAHGMRIVGEYMDANPGTFTVFGDNLNDLGMFALAGTSVAVANAHETVKEKANIVLEQTNDDDAVAHYLNGLA